MTTPEQTSLPDNIGARAIVAGGGALLMVVLAVIVYLITGMGIPTFIIVLLIPVHFFFAITDTSVLEDPKTAPVRAWREFTRLFVQAGPTVSSAWVAPVAQSVPTPGAPTPGAPTAGFPTQGSPTPPAAVIQPAAPLTPPAQPHNDYPSRPATPATPATPAIVHLGPGLSYEAPGPHGPSVVHGFGSYGGRPASDSTTTPTTVLAATATTTTRTEPMTTTTPPLTAANEAPSGTPSPAIAPAPPQEDAISLVKNRAESPVNHALEQPPTSPINPPAASSSAPPAESLPQWDDSARDDLDDPDMTIQRPPRS